MTMAEAGTLKAVVAHWLPRMHTAGLAPADLDRVIAAAGDWAGWCQAFCAEAARHEQDARAAEAMGRIVSAGAADLRAALLYHFGQFVFFDDLAQKEAAAAAKVAAYRRAAPRFAQPAAAVALPYGEGMLHGYLRRPLGPPAPLAILIPGSDSTKEEFCSLEHYFLERGLATLSIDGPGQGEGRSFGPLTSDWRPVLAALRRAVAGLDGIDADRVGLMGMAFGGHLALQGAAGFPEIRAVIAMNGFYDLGSFWAELPAIYRHNLRFALDGADEADTAARAARFSLAGVPPPACPILVIHGRQDRIFPVREADRLARFGAAQTVFYDQGNHVCNNLAYRYRALMADWLAERLRAD
jgi:2,6-dihydroxypseudooxynicotine hydrolase